MTENDGRKYFSNYSADWMFCISVNGDCDHKKLVLNACFKIAHEVFYIASDGLFRARIELDKIIPELFETDIDCLCDNLCAIERIWKDMGYEVYIDFRNPYLNNNEKRKAILYLNWSDPEDHKEIYCDFGKDVEAESKYIENIKRLEAEKGGVLNED